jgi:hypothetical protein
LLVSSGPPGASSPRQIISAAGRLVEEDSFLHYALQHQPTADLVGFVLEQCGGRSAGGGSTTHSGRTLLRTAAVHGCSPSVIETIVVDHDGSHHAKVVDEFGRCPLHWACVNPSQARRQIVTAVVVLLLKLYPEAAQVRDGTGNTPAQLAQMHDASGCVLRLLSAGRGRDDESHVSSSSSSFAFLRRPPFSPKKSRAPARRTLTPRTLPDDDDDDDGASNEGTNNDDPYPNDGQPEHRHPHRVSITQSKDDDGISSLGSDGA